MPSTTPTSIIDFFAGTQLPRAERVANRALDALISKYEPKGEKRDPKSVERALRHIMDGLDICHQTIEAVLIRSVQLRDVPPKGERIEGTRADTQHVLDLLEGTFGSEIGTGSPAETLAVQIAHNHASFLRLIAVTIQAAGKFSPKPTGGVSTAPEVKVTKKPDPKAEKQDPDAVIISVHEGQTAAHEATEGVSAVQADAAAEDDGLDEIRRMIEEGDAPQKPDSAKRAVPPKPSPVKSPHTPTDKPAASKAAPPPTGLIVPPIAPTLSPTQPETPKKPGPVDTSKPKR